MLRTLTPAELSAARLRRIAHELILEAEALEASAGRKVDGRNAKEINAQFIKKLKGERK